MSGTFFFLPSTVDRVEKINRHMGSVSLRLFDIQKSNFGEDFNPATLDLMRAVGRESVLNVLKKIVSLSSKNLKRNADAYLSTVSHSNDTLLWPGGKRTQSDKFALTY